MLLASLVPSHYSIFPAYRETHALRVGDKKGLFADTSKSLDFGPLSGNFQSLLMGRMNYELVVVVVVWGAQFSQIMYRVTLISCDMPIKPTFLLGVSQVV